MLVTLATFQVEMSPLKSHASWNIPSMLVTLDTSHLERSAVKSAAELKMPAMSVTADTSQDPIGACGPLEQSMGDSWRHCPMAVLNSALDFGAHPVVGYYNEDDTVRRRDRGTIMIRVPGSVVEG